MVIDFSNLGGGGGGSYTLPIASQSTLGGIKVGSGLTINSESGVLSAEGGQGGGIEVVSQLPASGTDGQMVILAESLPYIKLEGREGDFNPVSCTATGITQKTFLFSWEYYGDTWKVYVNADHSVEIYNDQNSQTTTYIAGTSGAVYNFTEDRYITTNVTSNGFVMTPNENVGRYLFVDDSDGGERQTLYAYSVGQKPTVDFHLFDDERTLEINCADFSKILSDGDVFMWLYFRDGSLNKLVYSANTLSLYYDNGELQDDFSPFSLSGNHGYEFIGLNLYRGGNTLKIWLNNESYNARFTYNSTNRQIFDGKLYATGWTVYGCDVVLDEGVVYAGQNAGMVKVSGNDGLYMDNGFIKCDVDVDVATTGSTGVVKPSSGLSIDSAGTLTTQVQTENVGNHIVKIWLGTQAEFDQIATPDQYTVYIIKQTTTQSN